MCGIFCKICKRLEVKTKPIDDNIIPLIQNRGPDSCQSLTRIVKVGSDELELTFCSTVLHLRGESVTKQPLINSNGDVLLWNGEIFGGLDVGLHENDTEILMRHLTAISQEMLENVEPAEKNMADLFTKIQGPWAFVFYQKSLNKLWYGRDYFGRRSLIQSSIDGNFLLTSAICGDFREESEEIKAKSIYCLNLVDLKIDDLSLPAFKEAAKPFEIKILPPKPNKHSLLGSIHRCTINYPPSENKISEGLEHLANITCFENDSTIDLADCVGNLSINDSSIEKIQEQFLQVLSDSVRTRVETIPRPLLQDGNPETSLGILFSGGIDSVVLAALAHRHVPPNESIDLINVAFEEKKKIPQNMKKKYANKPGNDNTDVKSFNVPDRLTGKEAVKELPEDRQWNFIEVDVTLEELQAERKSRINDLVCPLNTVLDDSIGCAIWFAARGMGKRYGLNDENELELVDECYKSKVKVLFTGMGADEQLGGYARHRTKYEHGGWTALRNEMKMEVDRISSRNLGRDDRCISDHGRETRFPFLDENVVRFLDSLPVCVKSDPRLERGYGEKILLREVAEHHLKLNFASRLPKRAIQFGSRIAKLESGKEKGSEKCERLK
ncbi:asparagine synthetase domain-containing protein 1-like [Clytia hemisphaerica]|uniref:asparagine synthetase domain-containing protein 1-like n=1 Tax=Clytia hemisphaerica TaxID=252671 RepID=UPI0034D4D45E|eukprot:TCONS_00002592-protein